MNIAIVGTGYVGLVTGNRRVNPNARVLVVVAEILLNRLLHTGLAHDDAWKGTSSVNLGVYQEWAVVDGVESAHVGSRVFSSGCATYATCASVDAACP